MDTNQTAPFDTYLWAYGVCKAPLLYAVCKEKKRARDRESYTRRVIGEQTVVAIIA
jgi:hypothetical protein